VATGRYPAAVRLLGVLLLALVAVSSPSAKPLPSPCSLVADWKLRAALGPKLRHEEPPLSNGARMCRWQRASDASEYREVTLTVQPLARERFTAKWNRPIRGVRPVRGVGELAYSIEDGLWLVAWRNGIEVTVGTTELKSPLPTAILVAKLALAHL
jgi:hypothetical protein